MKAEGATLFSASMAGTLRLMAYMAAACVLMVLDYRNHWLQNVRYEAAVAVVQPLYHLAGLPADGFHAARVAFANRERLTRDNRQLRESLLLANARLNRMRAVARQNQRLKQLLDTRHSLDMRVQLARLIDVDVGAFGNRIVLNVGANQGVTAGQPVIDANGVMGQVQEVLPDTSQAMLITDPNSAVPVTVERTGLRSVVYGGHGLHQLDLPDIPVTADLHAGDKLVTSGLGGRFPPGFPVGTVRKVSTDLSGMFLDAKATPAAALARSGDVLLLRDLAPPVGPPAPAASVGPPARLAPWAAGGESKP